MKKLTYFIIPFFINIYLSHGQTQIGNSKEPIFDFVINPLNKEIAYTKKDTIVISDFENMKTLQKLSKGHKDKIMALDYSPDGKKLVSGGRGSKIIIWDLKNPENKEILSGQKGIITSVKYSPDNKYIASGSSNNSIYLWTIANPTTPLILNGHSSDITDIEFIDEKHFISSDANGRIILWNINSEEKKIIELISHSDWIRDISFNNFTKELITCGDDSKVKIWDLTDLNNIKFKKEKKLGSNWITGCNILNDHFIAVGGHNRIVTVLPRKAGPSYSVKTYSNITKVEFVSDKMPFQIIYGTLDEGLYIINSKDMKPSNKQL